MGSRVVLFTLLTWIAVLDMLPHPSVNGTSEEFISTCGVRVCVCSGEGGWFCSLKKHYKQDTMEALFGEPPVCPLL